MKHLLLNLKNYLKHLLNNKALLIICCVLVNLSFNVNAQLKDVPQRRKLDVHDFKNYKIKYLSDKLSIVDNAQIVEPKPAKTTAVKKIKKPKAPVKSKTVSKKTTSTKPAQNKAVKKAAPVRAKPIVKQVDDGEYYFSDTFASSFLPTQTIASFNQKQRILPGKYDLSLYINDKFIKQLKQTDVYNQGANSFACLPDNTLIAAGVNAEHIHPTDNICAPIDTRINGAVMRLDTTNMNLYLTLGQNLLIRDYANVVDVNDLTFGQSIGFVNYYANYYHSSTNNSYNKYTSDYAYLSLSGGINFGLWQYRQSAYLNRSTNSPTTFKSGNKYLQRPILELQGNLRLGELNTSSNLLGGINFIGVDLSSDNRMLPNHKQGYAPQINGIARTNAKVSVIQNGNEIYQTTVAPGAFVINDLTNTHHQGDLTVIVTEADGTTSSFEVPFSVVPNSIRPGIGNYNFTIGKTNLSNITKQAGFVDSTYQYGLMNNITVNGGSRISDDYLSLVFGSVYSHKIGAFGANVTYSNTNLPKQGSSDGYMLHASYSKTFMPTNTSVTLANYRYSTKNYYELGDLLGIKDAANKGYDYSSRTYQLYSRFDISVSQSLNKYGHASVYAITSKYRGNLPTDHQLQLSYGNSIKGIGFGVNYARQYSSNNQTDNIFSLSLSIPLDGFRSSLDSSYTHSSNSPASHHTTINGVLGDNYATNYAVGVSHTNGTSSSYSANLGHNFTKVNTNFNASSGKNYWQAGAGASGALAVHNGGVTFGPYLSDTFALIEAKNATGAQVMHQHNIKVDRFGYALLPSLNPYRYSDVGLSPAGMNLNTEILDGSKRVAPYAGSSIKLTFATKTGYPILITGKYELNKVLPFAAEVLNEDGQTVGMVGQSGQIYIKAPNMIGKLTVRLPNNKTCSMLFDITNSYKNTTFTKLNLMCI